MSGGVRADGAVLAATVLWGTTGTVAHFAPAGSSHLAIGIATFGFGGAVLFTGCARAAVRTLAGRAAWPLLAAGAAGVIAYACLYYVSMQLTGVAVGNALALGSGPVWTAVFEWLGERRRMPGPDRAAILITVAGVLLLGAAARTGTAAHSDPARHPIAGVACALGAGCGYGLYSWAGARLIARGQPSRAAMAGIFALASAALVPAFFALGPGPLLQARGLLILAYLAGLPMAGAYLLFGYGLRAMPASAATTLALAEPVIATILATQILGEQLSTLGWVALGVIGAGLATVTARAYLAGRRALQRPERDAHA